MGHPLNAIRAFYLVAEDALERVRAGLVGEAKITLVVRMPPDAEKEIIISDDNLDEVIQTLERRKAQEPSLKQGNPLSSMN